MVLRKTFRVFVVYFLIASDNLFLRRFPEVEARGVGYNWKALNRKKFLGATKKDKHYDRADSILTSNLVYPPINPYDDDPKPPFNAAIMLKLGPDYKHRCSAVLLTYRTVLTVATDCILMGQNAISPSELYVQFITSKSGEFVTPRFQVHQYLIHDHCCSTKYDVRHDIAMVLFERDIVYDAYIRPAKLPGRGELYHPYSYEFWSLSNLRPYHIARNVADAHWLIKSSFIPSHVCKKIIKSYVMDKMTCVSYAHSLAANCEVDRGSGLSYKGVLIGILVVNPSCGAAKSAALFINAGHNRKWIINAGYSIYRA